MTQAPGPHRAPSARRWPSPPAAAEATSCPGSRGPLLRQLKARGPRHALRSLGTMCFMLPQARRPAVLVTHGPPGPRSSRLVRRHARMPARPPARPPCLGCWARTHTCACPAPNHDFATPLVFTRRPSSTSKRRRWALGVRRTFQDLKLSLHLKRRICTELSYLDPRIVRRVICRFVLSAVNYPHFIVPMTTLTAPAARSPSHQARSAGA